MEQVCAVAALHVMSFVPPLSAQQTCTDKLHAVSRETMQDRIKYSKKQKTAASKERALFVPFKEPALRAVSFATDISLLHIKH